MRRSALAAALAAAGLAGVVTTVAVTGGAAAPAAAPPPRVSTTIVVRTNLAASVLTGGTLGYAAARPLINQLAGTYTQLPAVGRLIRPGQVLYRVDNQPVVELRGRIPAWRPFGPGMTSGPDVAELQANLVALGYAAGEFWAPSGQYDAATAGAVQRWQAAAGLAVTGQVPLGQVVFQPARVRVGARAVAVGQPAVPGQSPFQVTTGRRIVRVPMNPTLPSVSVGQRVQIVLPSGARTGGRVTAVSPAPAGSARVSSVLAVTPDRPAATGTSAGVPVQVALTVQSARNVLAVPVSALLALAGGGYGLELVRPSGVHRLIGVRVGLFAGGLVQVSGPGLAPGVRVVVAS